MLLSFTGPEIQKLIRAPAAPASLREIALTGSQLLLACRKRSRSHGIRMKELPILHYSATPSLQVFEDEDEND
jgi:hypothetical protein